MSELAKKTLLKRVIVRFDRLEISLRDSLFLSLVVVLSFVLYIGNLGFYSDDWSFLGYLSNASDRSLNGLFQSIYSPQVQMRPVQILYLAGLHWLFGLHPLGYHLVNGAVFLVSVLLFYWVLRELDLPHWLALTIPLVYALLPHYCTNRFWIAANQANLSIALYFLSLYADLRGLRTRKKLRFWSWKLLSLLSLLGSTLAYEVALPLFLLNPLLVGLRSCQLYRSRSSEESLWTKLPVLYATEILALLPVLIFKVTVTNRIGDKANLFEQMKEISKKTFALNYGQYYYGLNIKHALTVNYGDYGLGLPYVVARILRDYLQIGLFALTVVLGLGIFQYLNYTARATREVMLKRTQFLSYIGWGLAIFGLGYAIFLTNDNVLFTPTGIGNRTAIAAAIGVAISFVGAIGWVSTFLPSERLHQRFFCILVSLLCASGFLINTTIASFWVTANRQQQAILADIRQQLPVLTAGSTLILDGVCPYVGPAIVFESSWDLAGALMVLYRDVSLRADIVTPKIEINEDGLSKKIYAFEDRYPYQNLFVYHFGRKTIHSLTDAETARHYFQTFDTHRNSKSCPEGHAGFGIPIF